MSHIAVDRLVDDKWFHRPFLGGVLSKPHDRWPHLFSSQLWIEYPYLLPCVASALFSALVFVVTLLFLKEVSVAMATTDELLTLHFQTVVKRPRAREAIELEEFQKYPADVPLPMRALLTWPILLSVTNYALLSFIDISFRATQPLFYSMPIELGGLGQSPAQIGTLLAAFGLMNGTVQALWFPTLVARWGPKRVFMAGMAAFIPLFILYPIINSVARRIGLSPLVWVIVFLQLASSVLCDMAYGASCAATLLITLTSCVGCIFMYVAASAPNRRSLGGTNGLAQVAASVVRAIGPAMSTSLFAASVEYGWLGGYAVYVILVFLTSLSLLVGDRLPKDLWDRVDVIS